MESGISLAEDSTLDPKIAPGGAPRITRISEASSVLLQEQPDSLEPSCSTNWCVPLDRTPGSTAW